MVLSIGIRLVEINEGGLSLAAGCIMGTGNHTAYGLLPAYEFCGIFGGDGIPGVSY
jgi:hypothetical protein